MCFVLVDCIMFSVWLDMLVDYVLWSLYGKRFQQLDSDMLVVFKFKCSVFSSMTSW